MNVWFHLDRVGNVGKKMRTGWCLVVLSLLASGALTASASGEAPATTETTLTASTMNAGARTRTTLTAHVAGSDLSVAPAGVITFRAGDLDLGSAFVDAEGNASIETDLLTAGEHSVVAAYQGQAHAQSSVSEPRQVRANVTTVAGFTVGAAPSSLSTTVGGFVNSTITVTPNNGFNAFVSLSCEGLPINTSCTFTPVSVLASCSATACTPGTSVMQIQTQAPSPGATASNSLSGSSLRYAFVLPMLLGLAGLGLGKRPAWRNLVLVLATCAGMMSLTACAARYRYLNHGPPGNVGSTPGTWTVTVESQSSTGSSTIVPPANPQIALVISAAK